ncbi:MAG: hypothetical protein H0V76_02190 [Blastocatellia bacterium]|nr:hypothetical protein [Blastocatellia bacterium]
MKNSLYAALFCVLTALSVSAQTKTSTTANAQIRALGAGDLITFKFEPAGGTTRVMFVAENFAHAEAAKAGILAINFAAGFFFAGETLSAAPDPVKLTFWVKSKKPRFAANHSLTLVTTKGTYDIGPSRYAAKLPQGMEYLNFEISREVLDAVAAPGTRLKLGSYEFTLLPQQAAGLKDFLRVSDPSLVN